METHRVASEYYGSRWRNDCVAFYTYNVVMNFITSSISLQTDHILKRTLVNSTPKMEAACCCSKTLVAPSIKLNGFFFFLPIYEIPSLWWLHTWIVTGAISLPAWARDKIMSEWATFPYLDVWAHLIAAKPTGAVRRGTNEAANNFHLIKLS